MMDVHVSRPITHRCPYVDEIDVGEVELRFEDVPAPELHELGRYLDSFAGERITHEELTERVAANVLGVTRVRTRFRTAGMLIETTVTNVPPGS